MMHLVRCAVWAVCIGIAGLSWIHATLAMSQQSNAIQQAALATEACMHMIFGYIFARAIDSMTRVGRK
jgi:hypothetical protein